MKSNLWTRIGALMDIKFWKFVVVGIVNTIIGTFIMFSLYNFAGLSYWVSSAMNYILTSILSYFLNKHFTFQHRDNSWKSALKFALNIAVCYIVAYGFAKPLTIFALGNATVSVQENVAMMVGMVFFTACNYLGQRFFAFK